MTDKCESCVARVTQMLSNAETYDVCALYQYPCDMVTKCDYYVVNADIRPVDTKEILKHLDSLMICITNAYNTSHGLLQSDMTFIEKQEKFIRELLSDKI